MNARETIELISKQWCTTEDIKKLTGLGKTSALKLKSKIKADLLNKGYSLPNKLLPMYEVVNYLKIDVDYLISINKNHTARKEE